MCMITIFNFAKIATNIQLQESILDGHTLKGNMLDQDTDSIINPRRGVD
jgi:hypothetical protein